jgi:nicotinamidase-related amidase
VIYANDNFGRWRSDLHAVVRHCLRPGVRGQPIARLLRPRRADYLVLKPKHSAFFASPLETLLRYLEVDRVILAGFAGNMCVLITANDLYMRDYELFVPHDCTASNKASDNAFALSQMQKVLKADVRASTELDLERMRGPPGARGADAASEPADVAAPDRAVRATQVPSGDEPGLHQAESNLADDVLGHRAR